VINFREDLAPVSLDSRTHSEDVTRHFPILAMHQRGIIKPFNLYSRRIFNE